jgi:5-methylcytosine-specific restriction protein B
MIDAVEFKKVVESYYNDFTQRYWDEEEGFKWKAVKAFSEKWDIDSSDFSAMLKAALKEAKPLLMVPNYFSSGMIGEFADAEPETVRQMFRDLYDESAELAWRFDNFKKQSIKLLSIIGKADKNHYQDEHAISIYLWLRYPAKYYIYKFTETQNMAKLLKSQYKFVSGHYTEILSNWLPFYDEVTELLQHEDALLQKVKGYITDDSYADESLRTLTSDFAFYITHHYLKAQEKNAWWPSNYTPAISESQWLSLLGDNNIFDDSSRTLIKQFADIGGQATCTELAKKYGGEANAYNSASVSLAKKFRVQQTAPSMREKMAASAIGQFCMRVKKLTKKQTAFLSGSLEMNLLTHGENTK